LGSCTISRFPFKQEEAQVNRLEEDIKKYGDWQAELKQLIHKLEQKREEYCVSLHRQFDHGDMD